MDKVAQERLIELSHHVLEFGVEEQKYWMTDLHATAHHSQMCEASTPHHSFDYREAIVQRQVFRWCIRRQVLVEDL